MPIKEVRMYDEHGNKRPYDEFIEDAYEAGFNSRQTVQFIHQQRSRHARVADESFRAVKTVGFNASGRMPAREVRAYYNNPNRMDVEHIDTTSDEYKRRRVERVREAYEGSIVKRVVEGKDLGGRTSGQFASGTGEVLLDKSPGDREATLAHELGHGLDYRLSGFRVSGFGHSEDAIEDEEYAEQVYEASKERRGGFGDHDEYRSKPTEQFADWFVGAVQEPRHTRATRGAPWESIEEQARVKGKERLEKLVETPMKAAQTDLYNAAFEASEDQGAEADRELFEKVDEGKAEIRRRFELEGHRESMEERVHERMDDLDSFRASNLADFGQLRIGNIHIEEDPLFEGSRRADLIPEETVRELEADLGQKLDIEGLN